MAVTWVAFALGLLALSTGGCRRKHVTVEGVAQLPYPSCPGDAGSATIARGRLRGLPDSMAQAGAIEDFAIVRRGCIDVGTVRLEWGAGATDVEVVWDAASGAPLRAWKRVTAPPWKRADIRRYELRTPEVTLTKRMGDDAPAHELVRGGRPTVVLAPGRGLLTAWIQRAKLRVGDKTRELALDVREGLEMLREVTLRREDDRVEPSLARTVRVYSIYGREPFFADEDDVVVGDLAGLRPSVSVPGPEPRALPSPSLPDPRNSP